MANNDPGASTKIVPAAVVKAAEEDYMRRKNDDYTFNETDQEEMAIDTYLSNLDGKITSMVRDSRDLDDILKNGKDSHVFNEWLQKIKRTLAPSINPDFLLEFIKNMNEAGIFEHLEWGDEDEDIENQQKLQSKIKKIIDDSHEESLDLPIVDGDWVLTHRIYRYEESFALAFSPDLTFFVSGTSEGIVRLWDIHNKERWRRRLRGHSGPVYSVTFSPDGSIIASGSKDGTVRLLDIHSGEEIRALRGQSGHVTPIAFSPDGTIIASGSNDAISLWDVRSGEEIGALRGRSGGVKAITFSPDRTIIATGSNDMSVRLWNIGTGELLRELKGHKDSVNSVAFTIDGTAIASGSSDETVQIWNVRTGDVLRKLKRHKNPVTRVAFSSDGTTLASVAAAEPVHLWNIQTGKFVQTLGKCNVGSNDILHADFSEVVISIAFSPDGETLASGAMDETVRLWKRKDLENPE